MKKVFSPSSLRSLEAIQGCPRSLCAFLRTTPGPTWLLLTGIPFAGPRKNCPAPMEPGCQDYSILIAERRYAIPRSESRPDALSPIPAPASRINRAEGNDLILVACLASLVFLFAHREGLSSPYVINDDVRQQIYWMQRWQDPELFQGDWRSDYARFYVPWGCRGCTGLRRPRRTPFSSPRC